MLVRSLAQPTHARCGSGLRTRPSVCNQNNQHGISSHLLEENHKLRQEVTRLSSSLEKSEDLVAKLQHTIGLKESEIYKLRETLAYTLLRMNSNLEKSEDLVAQLQHDVGLKECEINKLKDILVNSVVHKDGAYLGAECSDLISPTETQDNVMRLQDHVIRLQVTQDNVIQLKDSLIAALREKVASLEEASKESLLHWRPDEIRNGLGDNMVQVNHIALVVSDVGKSLEFYSGLLGFQRIRRPNFDRHGAWLTMGNIELHLIKGIPQGMPGQHPDDLIVTHIALECDNAEEIAQRMQTLKKRGEFRNVQWRQNLSLPEAAKNGGSKFESDRTSCDGKIVQHFFEDPDGYWVALCNCQVLNKFCLSQEEVISHHHHFHYQEGCHGELQELVADVRMMLRLIHWMRRAKASLKDRSIQDRIADLLKDVHRVPLEDVDSEKLANLVGRGFTHGDICQGFEVNEIKEFLAISANNVPTVILMMQERRQEKGRGIHSTKAP